jgi:hypothetical protein
MTDSHDDGEEVTSEQLPEPIRGMLEQLQPHQDHPAYQWFEMIVPGLVGGFLGGDRAVAEQAGHQHVYQFCRDGRHAYVWQSGEEWLVRPWRGPRDRGSDAVARVGSLRAALDELLRPPPPRPWWRFW